MPRVSETARVVTNAPPPDAPELVRNAWLLWTSVTNECKRKGVPVNDEGFYIYEGTLRGHVMKLWPMMNEEQRASFERSCYGFMKEIRAAKCIHAHSPTVWKIKATWDSSMSRSVPVRFGFGYVPTRAEAKLTPSEAGEDLPPGEVTVTTRETAFTMPTATKEVPKEFQTTVESRRAEMNARRELIVEWLGTLSEPVAAEEVAFAFGANIHTTRTDLISLAEQGTIYCRQETPEERTLRYGGTAYARRSSLYSSKSTVPARVSQVVVDGFSHVPSSRVPSMNPSEINRRLWNKLKRKGPRSRFTAAQLAEASGVQPEATRSRLRTLAKKNLVRHVGHDHGAHVFKVLNLDGIREYLEQPETDVLEQTVVEAPPMPSAPPVTTTPGPAAAMTVEEALARAVAVVAENSDLRYENGVLRNRVAELEAQLRQAQAPAVPLAAAEALGAWQPRSS